MHEATVERYGGLRGIRDMGLLQSAVARPESNMFGFEAYPDPFMKAAVLCHSLMKHHPFNDANKRTGFMATARFLEVNGMTTRFDKDETIKLLLNVAQDVLDERGIAEWLRTHSVPNH